MVVVWPQITRVLRTTGVEHTQRVHHSLAARVELRQVHAELVDRQLKRFVDQEIADVMAAPSWQPDRADDDVRVVQLPA